MALNDLDGVRPHAFVAGGGHKSVFDIPNLANMFNGHLCGQHMTPPTEFSSWAASLSVAITVYSSWGHVNDGYLAIVDTSMLPAEATVWHVPTLHSAGLVGSPYDHEYLIHGCVEGIAYTCVSFEELKNRGLSQELINPNPLWMPGCLSHIDVSCDDAHELKGPSGQAYRLISRKEARAAKQVALCHAERFAKCFDCHVSQRDDFTLILFTGLLARRAWSTLDFKDGDVDTILSVLLEEPQISAPSDWSSAKWIHTDCVFTSRYPDLRRMIRLLRMLVPEQFKGDAEDVANGVVDSAGVAAADHPLAFTAESEEPLRKRLRKRPNERVADERYNTKAHVERDKKLLLECKPYTVDMEPKLGRAKRKRGTVIDLGAPAAKRQLRPRLVPI